MHNDSESSLRSEKREEYTEMAKKIQSVLEVKSPQYGNREEEAGNCKSADSDVVFLGWQTLPSGEVVPLYNIMLKNHPLYHSTVTEETLRKHNLQVPQIPRAISKNIKSF